MFVLFLSPESEKGPAQGSEPIDAAVIGGVVAAALAVGVVIAGVIVFVKRREIGIYI